MAPTWVYGVPPLCAKAGGECGSLRLPSLGFRVRVVFGLGYVGYDFRVQGFLGLRVTSGDHVGLTECERRSGILFS